MRGLLLGIVLAFAYAGVLSNGWLNWDDPDYITANPLLTTVDGWGRIWGGFESPQYYPLTFTLLRLEHGLFGESAAGFHSVSLLLHFGNAWLLLRLLDRWRAPWCALAGAALFALHPIQVATVAWAAEQKTLLAGVFVLAAALTYHDPSPGAGRRRYTSALFLYIAALLSKTQPLLLPLLFPFLGRAKAMDPLALRGASGFSYRRWARRLVPLVPFLVAGLGASVVTALRERAPLHEGGLGLGERIALAGQSFWFGQKTVAWPIGLSALYPKWDLEATMGMGILGAAAALLLFVFLLRLARRGAPDAVRAFLLYVLPWLPASGLVSFGYLEKAYVADHLLYLSLAGSSSALAFILERFAGSPRGRRCLVVGVSAVGLAVCAFTSAARLPDYRDSEIFWRRVLARNESSPTAHNNLAVELATLGRASEAVLHWRTALSLRPAYYDARMNLARALEAEGRTAEAITEYEAALRAVPGNARARERLSALSPSNPEQGGSAEARYRASPQDPDLTARWVRVLIDQGKLEEAISVARGTLADAGATVSSAPLWRELGYALAAARHLEDATDAYRHAVLLTPTNADARMNLGVLLRAQGMFDQATIELEAALALSPRDPRILGNLDKARRRER